MFITSLTPEKATFSNGNTLTKEELTDFLVNNGYLNKGETLFVDAFWNQSDLLMIEREIIKLC